MLGEPVAFQLGLDDRFPFSLAARAGVILLRKHFAVLPHEKDGGDGGNVL